MTEANYKRFRCSHCTIEFEAKKEKRYCSKKCNRAHIKKHKTSVSRAEYLAKVRENAVSKFACEHCGKEAHRKLSGTNKAKGITNRFCSMDCRKGAAKARAQQEPAYSKVWAGYCVGCGRPFVSKRKRAYCSDECGKCRSNTSTQPAVRTCNTCGCIFDAPKAKTRPSDFCGAPCKAVAKAAHKRIARIRRKALQRGATVENVDPIKVFERDGWACRLCGIDTPKMKRGSYDDNAPELDHIIPLAKGGEHSYRNTQCACRKCNGEKSDKVLKQELAIG